MERRFQGVYPVLYAFFDADGRLDHTAMKAEVEHCLAAGAQGAAVLGLVSEVHRMTTAGRQEFVELVGTLIAGRVPYAVTVAEEDVPAQIEFARMAERAGADWVILQPPPGPRREEAELFRHFGAIADAVPLPVAIQNNPVNLASFLSPQGLVELVRAHENIRLLKAEGWSVEIAGALAALAGRVDAFGGHGGLEYLSFLRAGGAGLIPAPDCLALQVAMHRGLTSGNPDAEQLAGRIHKEVLPLVVFMTRSLPGLLCYGKRVMAARLGLEVVHDHASGMKPTAFGLAEMTRLLVDIQNREAGLLAEMQALLGSEA
ncbi:dihydrodipicolinate synthase family protein [Radicibacter daui]|uniref:dihydrodipicolinate synthase family protein n=1 Tax=Radicibacter daui TaxID=3064829 RepID=UPI004046AA3E